MDEMIPVQLQVRVVQSVAGDNLDWEIIGS